MPKPDSARILHLMGLTVTGDMGPLTFYTSSRHRLVFYARLPVIEIPTLTQLIMRSRWTGAAAAWQAQPKSTRDAWEEASKRAGCRCTGYNLWIYWKTTMDRPSIQTIQRQSGITLIG